MARAGNLKAVEPDGQNLVQRFYNSISSLKQKSADANTAVAGEYKRAGDAGLDGPALKLAVKFMKMDVAKAQGIIRTLLKYLTWLGFLKEEPKLVFTQTDLEDVEPAA